MVLDYGVLPSFLFTDLRTLQISDPKPTSSDLSTVFLSGHGHTKGHDGYQVIVGTCFDPVADEPWIFQQLPPTHAELLFERVSKATDTLASFLVRLPSLPTISIRGC